MHSAWFSLAISDAILALSSFFGVFLMFQCQKLVSVRVPVKAALFAYLLAGCGAAIGTLFYGFSNAWAGAHQLFSNAATTMSPALLAGACVCLLYRVNVQGATWWRLLIALMLGFEVGRQTGHVGLFQTIVAIVSLAAIAVATVLKQGYSSMVPMFLLGSVLIYALGAVVIGTEGSFGDYLRLDLYHYLLALGNLLSATALFTLLKNQAKGELSEG